MLSIAIEVEWSSRPAPLPWPTEATYKLHAAMVDVAGADLASVFADRSVDQAAICSRRRGNVIVRANGDFIDGLDAIQLRGVAATLHGQSQVPEFSPRAARLLFVFLLVLPGVVAGVLIGVLAAAGDSDFAPIALFLAFVPILLLILRLIGHSAFRLPWYRRILEAGDRVGAGIVGRETVLTGLEAMREWQDGYFDEMPTSMRILYRSLTPVMVQLHYARRAQELASSPS